ncbi:XRE family transcriptional regulator [Chitinophaga parva]|uniref:XRE family transcriptional regulator n=1 Tax=Chitinophaga parva TaxID=2169414 RepID=A0A2T7BM11_9BACT|nr:XRE family transcriptional regulator [Chitinophaga parva]PUZ28696.1 XRE family transcriptional regulator [Chitinophaga parva]
MKEDILIQISQRIKDLRKEKGITVQELATMAEVSKGLISQIENSRTIPSLTVLIDIVKALETDLNVFFRDISTSADSPVLIKRKEEYQPFEKEQATGFDYLRIFSRHLKDATIDIVLLELQPHATRPMVQTEAFEYKFIVSGEIEYIFEKEQILLRAGDSMLFDGRLSHTPRNVGTTPASMLVVYFFEERD